MTAGWETQKICLPSPRSGHPKRVASRPGGGLPCLYADLLFQANGSGAPVGIETLNTGEFLNHRERFANRLFVELNNAGTALELIRAETGE